MPFKNRKTGMRLRPSRAHAQGACAPRSCVMPTANCAPSAARVSALAGSALRLDGVCTMRSTSIFRGVDLPIRWTSSRARRRRVRAAVAPAAKFAEAEVGLKTATPFTQGADSEFTPTTNTLAQNLGFARRSGS